MTKHLYNVKEMVRTQLEQRPDTRGDDRALVYHLYRDNYGIVNDKWVNVIFNRELPSFESIRRTRQKLQAEDESLRPKKEVQDTRMDAQISYLEFATDDVWERWI